MYVVMSVCADVAVDDAAASLAITPSSLHRRRASMATPQETAVSSPAGTTKPSSALARMGTIGRFPLRPAIATTGTAGG
jgi:hypothetical protein